MTQAISAKITKLIGSFDGTTGVEQFLGRLQVASEMFGKEETADAMPFILDNRAFNVLAAMSSDGRKDLNAIVSRLRDVFGLSPINAATKMKERRLEINEPVDALMNDLRQQIQAMNLGSKDAEDKLLRLQFIASLPARIKSELQSKIGIEDANAEQLLTLASATMQSNTNEKDGELFAAVKTNNGAVKPINQTRSTQCEHCGRYGHIAKNCRGKNGLCYNCGGSGHLARNCLQRKPLGNELAGPLARTTSALIEERQ